MNRGVVLIGLGILAGLAWNPVLAQSGAGRIEGRITRPSGESLSGVTVVLVESSRTALSDDEGRFVFESVPPGTYSVSFALGENVATETGVVVQAGQSTGLEKAFDWTTGFTSELTVVAVSRRPERIVEAPAAVSVVEFEAIERQASHGQLPKLLEFTPGAEVTQSGLYDYNVNTRGFNTSLTRRVATLIDGRDPSTPFLGSQDWAAVSFPLDELERVEFVRGPSSALYGANASGGILDVRTRAPRFSQGGLLRLTVGEVDTANLDFRWADGLGKDWFFRVAGGIRATGDFSVSRMGAAEYGAPCPVPQGSATDCLPQEVVPLRRVNDDDVYVGSVRFDKYFTGNKVLTLEAGAADISGPVYQTAIGRVQTESSRPWARFNLSSDRGSLLGTYNHRDSTNLSLSAGTNFVLDESNARLEGQTNWTFAKDKVRLVAGGAFKAENIDSFDPAVGRQSLLFEPVDSQSGSLYAQVDWVLHEKLKLVLAGRWDESTLHPAQFSPKASAVLTLRPQHTLRFTYNEGFQVGNYAELFLQADAAPPADLTALNAFCTPFGVSCGFGPTRVLALGNEDLDVEKTRTWEIGLNSVIREKAFLTLDFYRSSLDKFITNLLPQLGTPLGRINSNYGPWQAPAGLPGPVTDAIRTAVPLLSNNVDGSNVLAAASFTNFGEAKTRGVDLGLTYRIDRDWSAAFNYSWFDFKIEESVPGLDTLLTPNSPENKLAARISYARDRWDVGFRFRWVEGFRWAFGIFQGNVDSYTTADLSANVRLHEHWVVGLNAANLFDDQHWESFGGDLLRRRALAQLTFQW